MQTSRTHEWIHALSPVGGKLWFVGRKSVRGVLPPSVVGSCQPKPDDKAEVRPQAARITPPQKPSFFFGKALSHSATFGPNLADFTRCVHT